VLGRENTGGFKMKDQYARTIAVNIESYIREINKYKQLRDGFDHSQRVSALEKRCAEHQAEYYQLTGRRYGE
jgi:hypothetical protein